MEYATRNLRQFQGSSWVICLRIPVQTVSGNSLLNDGALCGGEMGGHSSRSLNAGKGTPRTKTLGTPFEVFTPSCGVAFPVSRAAVTVFCVILFLLNVFRLESAK